MSWVSVGVAAANLIGGASAKKKAKRREEQALAQRRALAAPLANRAEELRTGATRQGLTNLQGLAIRAAQEGREGERKEALGQASADVAIAAGRSPTSLTGVFDRAMTRARGLSRLARHTSDQFDNALLAERIGLVKQGRSRQGTGLMGVLDSIGLRAGTLAAGQASREAGAETRQNIYGTVFGLGLGAVPDIRAFNQRRRLARSAEGGLGAGGGVIPINDRGLV